MRRDRMSRMRDALTAERLVLPSPQDAPRQAASASASASASWLPGRAALRDAMLVWLMRAGMLAYILMVVKALEAVLLALQRWF